MPDMKQAASNLIDAGFSDDEIKSTLGQLKNYAGSLVEQGKSDQEINDTLSKSQVIDKGGQSVNMFKPAEKPYDYYGIKGIGQKAVEAVKNAPENTRSLVNPATEESNPVAKVVRPVARGALGAMGTVFAPGAGAAAGLGAIAHDYYKMLGLPQNVADYGEKVTELATGAGMPSGVASGGAIPAIGKVGNFVGEMARVNPVAKAVNEAGGTGQAITNVARDVAAPISGAGLEATGNEAIAAQKAASKTARATGSAKYETAINEIPAGATVSSDFAKTINESLPSLKTGQPAVGSKLQKLGGEVEGASAAGNVPEGVTLQGQKFKDLSPEMQQRVGALFGGVSEAGTDFRTLDTAKRNMGQLWKSARTDDDRRLLGLASDALERDMLKFSDKYPEAMAKYKEAQDFWKTEVAQYHSQGAPLRDLVDNTYGSQIVDTLAKKPIEEIRNVVAGLGKTADGQQALKHVGDSVLSNIMTASVDKVSGQFNPRTFVNAMRTQGIPEKLQTLLGPEAYANVQNFTDKTAALVQKMGDKAFLENTNPMMKTMGYFHLMRGTQEAIVGLPMAFYQFTAAGTMLLGPKLMGQLMQTRAAAPMLADMLAVAPSARGLQMSKYIGKIADGLGAVQIPATAARTVGKEMKHGND